MPLKPSDMQHLSIEIKNTPDEAPNYNNIPGWKAAKIIKALVVRKGTHDGNDTVDLQFECAETGQKFVAFTTGKLIQTLAATIGTGPVNDI